MSEPVTVEPEVALSVTVTLERVSDADPVSENENRLTCELAAKVAGETTSETGWTSTLTAADATLAAISSNPDKIAIFLIFYPF